MRCFGMVKAYLYDAEGRDCETDIDAAALAGLSESQLVWFDIDRCDHAAVEAVATLLALTPDARRRLGARRGNTLDHHPDHFQFSVPAPPDGSGEAIGHLDFLIAPGWLLTVRDGEVSFLRNFRDQDKGETMKGALSPATIAASLLDWHLESYFDAISDIEAALDKLDSEILAERTDRSALERLGRMRRRVALLRGRIADQRSVFHGLVRPDFGPVASGDAAEFFHALAGRFDRAVDSVERARDVVIGSFELFASKTALDTNDLVKALTFVTVVIGFAAAIAGIFGMNFETPFFKTGVTGFYEVLGGLVVLTILATVAARWRRWI